MWVDSPLPAVPSDDFFGGARAACDEHQRVLAAGVRPALRVMERSAAVSSRLLDSLEKLARYFVEEEEDAADSNAVVRDAVLTYASTLTSAFPGIAVHNTISNAERGPINRLSPNDALLRLGDEARHQFAAAARASKSLAQLDLYVVAAEIREGHARERDAALQACVHLEEARLAGMRSQERIQEAIDRRMDAAKLDGNPGIVPWEASTEAVPPEDIAIGTGDVGRACASLEREADSAGAADTAALRKTAEIAERIAAQHRHGRNTLDVAKRVRLNNMRRSRIRLESLTKTLERRVGAEMLLDELREMHVRPDGKMEQLRKGWRKSKRRLEDCEDELPYGDPRIQDAQTKVERCAREFDDAKIRRDTIIDEIYKLSGYRRTKDAASAEENSSSISPPPPSNDEDGVDDETEAEWGLTNDITFPDLPARAHQLVYPREAYEAMTQDQKATADMQTLLASSGLFVCERSYNNYDMGPGAVPPELRNATGSKPNVKGARLRGGDEEENIAALKVLKEFHVDEYKRVQRAISLAGSMDHPGLVKVECAFLEKNGTTVVVQMPYYAGGNLRSWARRHHPHRRDDPGGPANEKAVHWRVAQRVAEAVAALHERGFLHRDLKPENVVLDGEGEDASPALCDFDLATPVVGTLMATTQMRGTLLYMPPDPEPSPASDVYALGVTLLDAFIFEELPFLKQSGLLDRDGVRTRLRAMRLDGGGGAATGAVDVGLLLELLERMIADQPTARPSAREVADEMARLLDSRTCCICCCLESNDEGVLCCGSATPPAVSAGAAQRSSGHFCCDECFSSFVSTQLDAVSDDCKTVGCPSGRACPHSIPLGVALAHASSDAGNVLMRNVESFMQKEMQGELERLMREHESKLARMSENQRMAMHLRKEIEEIVELRCTRCRHVFFDFDGCLALSCANDRCRAGFCGLCLRDCGGDAHGHVRECALNPEKGEFFLSKERWRVAVKAQTRKKLEEHWRALEARHRSGNIAGDVMDAVGGDASVRAVFRDHGLPAPPSVLRRR